MAESDANARLIAAAPELLEACNIWIEYFDHFLNDPKAGSDEDNLLEMRKAIAKAEGKEETNEVRTEQV